VDIAEKYGVPLKPGIPALAVLDSRGKVIHARHMSYESIKTFFEQWKPKR